MKIRTINYIFKEGIVNSYKNKLMTLASLSIITASLIVFGMFLLVTINANYNMELLEEQPEIHVFCYTDLGDDEVQQVENYISSNSDVKEYTKITKAEAFETVKKELLDGKEELVEGFDESIMPVSFILKLKDPSTYGNVIKQLQEIPEIEKVESAQQVMDFISRVTYWIPLICVFLLAVLLAVSMFIISNTIKLTVFARRKEIGIMKYIGATDWFIRWPFVIEGVLIGLIGALLAFVLIGLGYNAIESRISADLINAGINIIRFVKMSDVGARIIAIYMLVGVTVGGLGSVMSVRKYLHV